MSCKTIAVIAGDDAAPEAMWPTLSLIDKLGLDIAWDILPSPSQAMESHGDYFPDAFRANVDQADAILFGAASGLSAPAAKYLRCIKQPYVNVRPVRWFAGCKSPLARPEGIDFVIVGENLEDLYTGLEGPLSDLANAPIRRTHSGRSLQSFGEGNYAIKFATWQNSERAARYAFDLARRRKRDGFEGKVTCSAKYNVLPLTDGLFRNAAAGVAKDYPDIIFETFIIDDLARRMVAEPQKFDVVFLNNMGRDIISDVGAGIIGGLGLCPSGCYGDDFAYFEPAHGSAPDIAGKQVINPVATILSAVMMLDFIGFGGPAAHLRQVVENVYAEGSVLTIDQGGCASTNEFCEAVATHLTRIDGYR